MPDTTPTRILILSWEIYPMFAGGLGPLARSVVDELRRQGAEVTVLVPVVPKAVTIDDVISLEKGVKKFYREKKSIPNFEFGIDHFRKSNRPDKFVWPNMFQPDRKKPAYNLYPNHTPALTKAFGWAVLDYLKQNSDWDIVLGMDWMAAGAFHLMKSHEIKIPFGFYVNSTEHDRSPEKNKVSQTSRQLMDLEKREFAKADFILSVSQITKTVLVEEYDLKPDNIYPIFNDIPFTAHTTSYESLNKGKNVLFIGRVAAQKGLYFLLDTAKKVIEIDPQIKFIIAGDGEILADIVEGVAERELEKNCLFTGWVNDEQKKLLYRSSDLFVMPSPSEPFGLTPLEAIRSDLPVISSENCGFIGVIPSTPTFKYYDTNSFTHLILHYLNHHEDRTQLIRDQKKELKKHSWAKEVAKIIDLAKTYKLKSATKSDKQDKQS
jgi:glycosyltransferase involved in cell wall biosynthesis